MLPHKLVLTGRSYKFVENMFQRKLQDYVKFESLKEKDQQSVRESLKILNNFTKNGIKLAEE